MKRRSGRIIGVFGVPCSGKTTLIETLVQSSKEIIAHIKTGDIAWRLSTDVEIEHMAGGNLFPFEDRIREEILKIINKRRGQGAELIFLDSCPRFDDQVKWMLDNQLAGTEEDGCFIKVIGENLQLRAEHRMRNDQDELDKLLLKIEKQDKMINQMEKMIFQYSIPYYTIINYNLLQASSFLARIVGLRK